MGFLGWVASIGGRLLLMSLASGWIRHLPMTTFSLYLAAGVVAGPWMLDLLGIDFVDHALGIARVTEVALVISLFMTGLKLRMDFRDPGWHMAVRLALPAMMITVAGICALAHWARYWLSTGMAVAIVLFIVVRPLAVYLATAGSGIPLRAAC